MAPKQYWGSMMPLVFFLLWFKPKTNKENAIRCHVPDRRNDNMLNNKILFCGDPHGCFANVISAVFKYQPEAVVLLGDYNLEAPLEQYLKAIIGLTQVYWIAGNHDFDSQAEYENLFHSAFVYSNLHLKVIDVAGLRIAGLGGIFIKRNWMPGDIPKWKNKAHWLKCKPSNIKRIPLHIEHSIWHHQLEKMRQHIRADILVCHEAPSCHRYGYQVIDELAQAIGATQIVHGHHHIYYQGTLANGISVTGTSIGGIVNLSGKQLISRGGY